MKKRINMICSKGLPHFTFFKSKESHKIKDKYITEDNIFLEIEYYPAHNSSSRFKTYIDFGTNSRFKGNIYQNSTYIFYTNEKS